MNLRTCRTNSLAKKLVLTAERTDCAGLQRTVGVGLCLTSFTALTLALLLLNFAIAVRLAEIPFRVGIHWASALASIELRYEPSVGCSETWLCGSCGLLRPACPLRCMYTGMSKNVVSPAGKGLKVPIADLDTWQNDGMSHVETKRAEPVPVVVVDQKLDHQEFRKTAQAKQHFNSHSAPASDSA